MSAELILLSEWFIHHRFSCSCFCTSAGVDPDDGGNETQTNVLVFPAYTPPSPPPRNVALAALAANLRMKDLLSGYHLGNSKTPSRQVIRYRDKWVPPVWLLHDHFSSAHRVVLCCVGDGAFRLTPMDTNIC